MQLNTRNSDNPCFHCDEKFNACSDHCPKDARGEFGKEAWREQQKKIKAARREYYKQRYEENRRSEYRKRWR